MGYRKQVQSFVAFFVLCVLSQAIFVVLDVRDQIEVHIDKPWFVTVLLCTEFLY